jgi:hypothetical protein
MSDIWKHFNKISKDSASCKICSSNLKRSYGSTKGLWKHLEGKHQKQYKELKSNESGDVAKEQVQDKYINNNRELHIFFSRNQSKATLTRKKVQSRRQKKKLLGLCCDKTIAFYFLMTPISKHYLTRHIQRFL